MDLGELRHLLSALTDHAKHHLGDRMENGPGGVGEGSGSESCHLPGEPEVLTVGFRWPEWDSNHSCPQRPCQAGRRAHRRGRGMAAQDEFPVLAQRHAAPSEFRTWVHGEAVCDLRGLGSPGKTISNLRPETGPEMPESK